jgi:hypothetical protein
MHAVTPEVLEMQSETLRGYSNLLAKGKAVIPTEPCACINEPGAARLSLGVSWLKFTDV